MLETRISLYIVILEMDDILSPSPWSASDEGRVNWPSIIGGTLCHSSIHRRSPFERACIVDLQLAHFECCLNASRYSSYQ